MCIWWCHDHWYAFQIIGLCVGIHQAKVNYLHKGPVMLRFYGVFVVSLIQAFQRTVNGWWNETSRVHSVYATSKWEKTLHCNVVFYWLGAYTKWSLDFLSSYDVTILLLGKATMKNIYCWKEVLQMPIRDTITMIACIAFHFMIRLWC